MIIPSPSAPVNLALVLGSSTGGIGRHVRMLAAGCAARGLAVQVLGPARTDRDFAFEAAARFTPVEIASRPRPLRDLRAIARLRRLLGAGRTDVVHAHGLRAGALAAAALASSRRSRPALVVTVHNAPPPAGVAGAAYRALELLVARRADSVLCVSADLERRMRAAGGRRVGHAVVPASSAPLAMGDVSAETRAATRAGLGAAPDQAVVLAVGRLAAQKGFGVLLEAAARWRDTRPVPLLVIAGQGPLAAGLESRAASLGLEVRFAGHRADVSALLAAADVFVLPSVWEGQSLVLQEALRAAAPIVATRVGGNQDLTGGDAAILVPPGNAGRLADAVRAVLTDPALAARLRKAAADRAHTLPSEDDAVAAALAEYRHVARTRR
jgi:glycosyltransferase involved in cell wall biosynthesis